MFLMKVGSLVLAAVLLVGASRVVAQTAHEQPSREQEPITLYKDEAVKEPQPQTVMDRVAEVDAVVRGRIEKSEVKVFPDSFVPPALDPLLAIDVMTEQTITILEVIKPAPTVPPVGEQLVVLQQGGAGTVKGRRSQGSGPRAVEKKNGVTSC